MAKETTDADRELLSELGVETTAKETAQRTPREERIIQGFEEIEQFVEEHGRLPQHGEDRDIFERCYAVRLERLRESEECRTLLEPLDSRRLLAQEAGNNLPAEENLDDEALLASLGVDTNSENDVRNLTHVRPRQEIKAAEEIAQRTTCEDFAEFKPVFKQVQRDLETGERKTLKYQDNAAVNQGDLFILDGQTVLVADMGDWFTNDYGRKDRRLRVIYDNGTESDLLLRSLQRALNKDATSRRITTPDLGPLFSDVTTEGDLETGYIYVLRSQSDNPFITEHRSVIHKIGVTGGDVKTRVANAKKDPTYLLADVEVVETFKLVNINRTKLEALLHKFFNNARLDLELKDRFGIAVQPREWFLVPLEVIEEVIEKIREGTIAKFQYDPKTLSLKNNYSSNGK